MSPYLFSIYVDDLIKELRHSGHGIHVGMVFIGCILYADDIVLLSGSCYGLQKWLTFAVIMVIDLILNLIHERVKLQFLEGLPPPVLF